MTGSGTGSNGSRTYAAGATVAIAASVLMVWTTIVHDDGNGIGVFMVILAAGVGGFAARFRAEGMARAVAGVALMQVLLGIAIATAPSTASTPGGSAGVLAYNGIFALAWLAAAGLFRAAARAGAEVGHPGVPSIPSPRP